MIVKAVLLGGVARREYFPAAPLKEMYKVGNRPRHYRGFVSLLHYAASWETATTVYRHITVPVLLVWVTRIGPDPASACITAASYQAQMVTVDDSGHFLSTVHSN